MLVLLVSSNCSLVVSTIAPLSDLPKPSGLYHVGTRIFEWEDRLRDEWFTTEINDYRRIVVQVWYPTQENNSDYLGYLDFPEKRIGPISKRIDIPKWLIKHIQDISTNSVLNASIISDKASRPLIIFSHGLGGMRMQNTIQMEELASHGYVVLALDHPYDANITVFLDGKTADFRSWLREDATEEEFWEVRLPQINTRAADISFILDNIKSKLDEDFWRHVDLSRVGVMGHSFGGATGVVSSFNDNRIDACIMLDGWTEPIESRIIQKGLEIPLIYIGQEVWLDTPLNHVKLDSLISSSDGEKIILFNTKHFDYSDTPQFSPIAKKLGIAGDIDIDELRIKINREIVSFFDLHVRKK